MKLKITITGPKVQGVGYRPYLAELAMRLALRGFEVYNEGDDAVVALLESDDLRVKEFFKLATLERPSLALVDNVKSEDFTGDVMPLWQFASINSATQMNREIPILLEMRDDIKGLREDIQPGLAVQLGQVQADIRAIKSRLGMP
ncbi:Acylphosphatase [uncultured archaeon]|nr:Acylphosphatase [uncultured archaeon]